MLPKGSFIDRFSNDGEHITQYTTINWYFYGEDVSPVLIIDTERNTKVDVWIMKRLHNNIGFYCCSKDIKEYKR